MKRFSRKTVLKILIASFSNLFINYLSNKNVTSSKYIFSHYKKPFRRFATYHFPGDALTFKMFEKLFKTLKNYYR